ncbi:hypothetical protein VTK73DRAFT_4329 [Phialemonium thermophilum]|uniref:Uncharacterized protein n=1 Tax=Phialemonium thermophilum TaxID=223376 RepID=A0ABR3V9Q8_9PEZI
MHTVTPSPLAPYWVTSRKTWKPDDLPHGQLPLWSMPAIQYGAAPGTYADNEDIGRIADRLREGQEIRGGAGHAPDHARAVGHEGILVAQRVGQAGGIPLGGLGLRLLDEGAGLVELGGGGLGEAGGLGGCGLVLSEVATSTAVGSGSQQVRVAAWVPRGEDTREPRLDGKQEHQHDLRLWGHGEVENNTGTIKTKQSCTHSLHRRKREQEQTAIYVSCLSSSLSTADDAQIPPHRPQTSNRLQMGPQRRAPSHLRGGSHPYGGRVLAPLSMIVPPAGEENTRKRSTEDAVRDVQRRICLPCG